MASPRADCTQLSCHSAALFLPVTTGTRKMEYKGSSWHETCFICHRCQQPIGTKSFIPKDEQNFCVPCYEKQHALQCVQCKKVPEPAGPCTRESVWAMAHPLVLPERGAGCDTGTARKLHLCHPLSIFSCVPDTGPWDLCSSLSRREHGGLR